MSVGGCESTGVFALVLDLVTSLLLQAAKKTRLQRKTDVQTALVLSVILNCGRFALFVRQRLTGHAIFAFNPFAQVYELAPLGTEGTKSIAFPLAWFTAGWTLHGTRKPRLAGILKRCRSFNQYSSFDECDRTFAAHGIQADGDTFSGGTNNGGYFAVG